MRDLAFTNRNTSEMSSEMFYIFWIFYLFFGWNRWISFKLTDNFGPCGVIFWGEITIYWEKFSYWIRKWLEGSIHEWKSKSWEEITYTVPQVMVLGAILISSWMTLTQKIRMYQCILRVSGSKALSLKMKIGICYRDSCP